MNKRIYCASQCVIRFLPCTRTVKLVFILSETDAESPSTASSTSDQDRNLGQRIFRLSSPSSGRKNLLKYASEKVQTTLHGLGVGGNGGSVPQRTSSDVREGGEGREGGREEGRGGMRMREGGKRKERREGKEGGRKEKGGEGRIYLLSASTTVNTFLYNSALPHFPECG